MATAIISCSNALRITNLSGAADVVNGNRAAGLQEDDEWPQKKTGDCEILCYLLKLLRRKMLCCY